MSPNAFRVLTGGRRVPAAGAEARRESLAERRKARAAS